MSWLASKLYLAVTENENRLSEDGRLKGSQKSVCVMMISVFNRRIVILVPL
jgi:hypothetical protein